MKKILIINGSGGVGKDTFVSCLARHANVIHISIVDRVKTLAKEIGWSGKKTERDRKFLSDLKVLIDNYNDANLEYVESVIDYFDAIEDDDGLNLLCIDMREKGQINAIRREYDAEAVLVMRSSVKPITSNMADADVFNTDYDYTIMNNGTIDDLDRAAALFCEILYEEEETEDIEDY